MATILGEASHMRAVMVTESPMEIGRLQRVTLHQQVVDIVRDLIIDGTLLPGSRVIESDLGQKLGVSRTPLREALKTLAGEGLIELHASRGAYVHAPSITEARDLLEVLTGLEAIAVRLACDRAEDGEIAAMRRMQDAMADAHHARQRLEYYKLNIAIHEGFVGLAHNRELQQQHAHCAGRLRRLRFMATNTLETWQAALDEHELMLRALERRDAESLAALMLGHMQLVWARMKMSVGDPSQADANNAASLANA